MPFSNSLQAASAWLTYFTQVALGYVVCRSVCSLVQSPRVRMRLWGCFLFLTAAAWSSALLSSLVVGHGAPVIQSRVDASFPLRWSWAVGALSSSQLSVLRPWLVRIYCAGLLILLLQLVWHRIQLQLVVRASTPPSKGTQVLCEQLCRGLNVNGCRLKLVTSLRSPGTAGWFRPYIFLPVELVRRLSNDQLADILRHEVIHVRDRDYLWDRMAALACRLAWFHPALWLAHRRLRWERELACDQAVIAGRAERRFHYAECLTTLASWWFLAEPRSARGIGFASSPSLLGTRVRALLCERSPRSFFQQAWRTATVAATCAATAVLLPSVGFSFYSLPLQGNLRAGIQQARRIPGQIATRNQPRRMTPASAPPQQHSDRADAPAVPHELAGILSAYEAPVPLLVKPLPGEGKGTSTQTFSTAGIHTGSHSTWDEAGALGAAHPTWHDVAKTAIDVGVSVLEDEAAEGEQPNN